MKGGTTGKPTAWIFNTGSFKPIAVRELRHGRGPGAAVAADVRLFCPLVNRAELTGKCALVPGDCPGSACHGHVVAAVRPAEHHPEVHSGHVALAAASVTAVAVLGAAGGATPVVVDDGDPAEALVEADAVVGISGWAVAVPRRRLRRGKRWAPWVEKQTAAPRPLRTGDGTGGALGVADHEGAVRWRVAERVCDAGRRHKCNAAAPRVTQVTRVRWPALPAQICARLFVVDAKDLADGAASAVVSGGELRRARQSR